MRLLVFLLNRYRYTLSVAMLFLLLAALLHFATDSVRLPVAFAAAAFIYLPGSIWLDRHLPS